LHAALGRQKSRQPGVLHVQQRKVLRQLAVKEFRGVFAFHANHAEVGQGGNTVQKLRHG